MTYDIGDLARLTVTFKDIAGALTDPTAVSIVVQDPAGAETTPGGIVHESTGIYHYDLSVLLGGVYAYRWVATGAVQAVQEGTIRVTPTLIGVPGFSGAVLCSLADAKSWLAIPSATVTEDEIIARLITAVSYDFIREIRRTDFYPALDYSETREGDGGDRIVLRHWPINSISAVTVGGVTINASGSGSPPVTAGYYFDTDLDPERRWEAYLRGSVFTDTAVVTIAYNAGYEAVPADANQAVIEWVAHRYKTRQWIGQTSKHMVQGETVQTPESEIPMAVKRVIERYRRFDPLQTPPERVPPEPVRKK